VRALGRAGLCPSVVSPEEDKGCVPARLHGTALEGWGHLGSVSATLSLKVAMPWELSLLHQCLMEELFVPLTPTINFKARRSHYGWLA